MSIPSYQKNRSRGVTGRFTPTCLPASLEQISPNHAYRPGVYRDYEDWIDWYCTFSLKERDKLYIEYEEMIDVLVRPLGGLACEDLKLSHADTVIGFLRIVRPLLADGYRVVCLTGGNSSTAHAVGLLPVGGEHDLVTLVSNQVPKSLSGIVSLRKIAERISVPDERAIPGHPAHHANIIGLPPDEY
jgi:hypothetical protein